MNLKDLKEFYIVESYNKDQYLLFNPIVGSGKNLNTQYYCMVERVGNGFKVVPSEHVKNPIEAVTDVYTHISVFKSVVERYIELLPYHSDFYYPLNRSYVFHMLAVNEFLRNLGFKSSKNETYIFEEKNIYGGINNKIEIKIDGLDMFDYEKCEQIRINLYTSNSSCISIDSNKDADSIISTLSSLLKPLFLTSGISNIEMSDKLGFDQIDPTLNQLDMSSFSVKSESYKQELRNKLEEILSKLK